MKIEKMRKMPSEATFATMTMAFKNEALSTPRMTKKVKAHMNSEATITHGSVFPGKNVGKKYPRVDIIIVANAMLPSHAESQ